MTFSLSPASVQSDVVEAVNYLLGNFTGSISANNKSGQIIGPTGNIIAYLYKYLAVKYADNITGQLNFSDSPTNRLYYGLRNSNNIVESTSPQDYVWTLATGGFGTTKFFWYSVTGGRQILINVSTTKPNDGYIQDNGNSIDLDIITTPTFSPVSWVLFRSANDSSAPTNAESQFALNRNPISGDTCTINYNSGTQSIQYLFGTTSWSVLNRYITGSIIKNLNGLDCSISVVQYIDINTGLSAPAYQAGRFWYDQSTNTLSYNNNVSGTTIHLGTNSTASPVAGTVAYGTGTALAYSAAGTSGQVLTSAGASVPTWTTPLTTGTSTSILYGNGSGGFSNVAIGGGISFSGGTLSASGSGGTITAVTGTAPIASSGGTTPAISISQSSGSTNGYLSSTDWTTFNSKQPAGTYVNSVSGTSPLTSSGGVNPTIAIPVATSIASGYLASADWVTFNSKQPAGAYLTSVTADTPLSGAGTSTSHLVIAQSNTTTNGYLSSTDWNTFNNKGSGSVTSVSGTAPVASTGGATPVISMAAATTSVNGYLTSTDWTTFNNKSNTNGTVTSVAALTLGTTGTDLSSTVLTGTTTPVITLQVPTASASNRGALSSADWSTFNGKQAAGTYVNAVTGTSPVVSSGGTSPAISMAAATASVNGYLTSTDWSTFNGKQAAGTYVNSVSGTAGRITSTGGVTPVLDLTSGIATAGTTGSATLIPVVTIDTYGRVTSISTAANPQGTVTSVSGTSPIVSSGGAAPAISIPAATTSVNGYLTSTDWNTFNNKGSGSVTAVSVISANGLAGTSSGGATPALTLSTSVTGLLKGNGTAISAAVANTDYVPLSTVLTNTADYTITNTDTWIINNKSGSTFTLTFPAASSWTGRSITVKNMQTQSVISASSNIVPIDSTTAGTTILLPVIGNWATMVSDGTNWVIMQSAPNNILLLE